MNGKLLQQKEMAALANVSEGQVSRWNSDPVWQDAVAEAMRESLKRSPWLRAELASAGRASRGSIRDWELYLEHGGKTSWAPEGTFNGRGEDATGPSVAIHVHGIPDRKSFDTLPPAVLQVPATAATQTSRQPTK